MKKEAMKKEISKAVKKEAISKLKKLLPKNAMTKLGFLTILKLVLSWFKRKKDITKGAKQTKADYEKLKDLKTKKEIIEALDKLRDKK